MKQEPNEGRETEPISKRLLSRFIDAFPLKLRSWQASYEVHSIEKQTV